MKTKLLTTYALSLFDLACTMLLVQAYGIGIEANPLGAVMLSVPLIAVLYKVIGVGLLLGVLWRCRECRLARIGAWVAVTAYALLTAYHLVGLIYVWRVL